MIFACSFFLKFCLNLFLFSGFLFSFFVVEDVVGIYALMEKTKGDTRNILKIILYKKSFLFEVDYCYEARLSLINELFFTIQNMAACF